MAAAVVPVLQLRSLARLCSFQHRQHAGAADTLPDGETEGAHAPGQRRGCPHLFEGQLRVLMQLPSQRNQPGCQLIDVVTEVDEGSHCPRMIG